MTIYIDISTLEKNRTNTGIQRVIKEFLQGSILNDNINNFRVLSYNWEAKKTVLLDNNEVKLFLTDVKNFKFNKNHKIDIETIKVAEGTIFFDMDSPWYAPVNRAKLYPILKENGFLIFNFLYDLIPVILPEVAHKNTIDKFKPFLEAVYKHSDMVFFDSRSANNDFLDFQNFLHYKKNIPSRVIGLGSDFLQSNLIVNDTYINSILQKKYILFVGTIEPRKNQENVLDAFEVLSKKYSDLNLVIIGKNGWKVENLIYKINNHPLKEKRFFWLNDIDDDMLKHFYKNAYIVTYLSKYEGYGLPIAESLSYGNITVASKNSSMYEVGKDFADYIVYNSQNELVDLISLYYENTTLYDRKKQYIKENYTVTSWNTFYNSVIDVFNNFEKSISLRKNHLKILQFVFISIEIKNITGTIEAIDKYMDFVKEYIIITAPKFMKEFQKIKSTNKITIIDETTILNEHANDFHLRDHQSKNWLLRASLLNLDILEDEFIMLDDDNRPLKQIALDKFITKDGRYSAYFFTNLLDWNHQGTEYDKGQQNMKNVLSRYNYELLSYSSHAPQIINKKIFKEATDKFFEIGLTTPIDEWSIYFNYAISTYPYAFNKKVFETLNWPASPFQWDFPYIQREISFENYYKEVYDTNIFKSTDSYEEKLFIKEKQREPFRKSKIMYDENKEILSLNNMVHGILEFKNNDIELYLSSVPYYVTVEQNSDIRLKLNYKLLNKLQKDLSIEFVIFLNGRYRTLRKIENINSAIYQESIIEMPIISSRLNNGIYNISFHIVVNNKYIYPNKSPYIMKLIVGNKNSVVQLKDEKEKMQIKNKIKSIPFLGCFFRWSYNLLRLNNLKHIVYKQKQQLEQQKQQLEQQKQQLEQQKQDIKKFYQVIDNKIAQQISFQADSVQQRIDQFIFDTKIDLNEKI